MVQTVEKDSWTFFVGLKVLERVKSVGLKFLDLECLIRLDWTRNIKIGVFYRNVCLRVLNRSDGMRVFDRRV